MFFSLSRLSAASKGAVTQAKEVPALQKAPPPPAPDQYSALTDKQPAGGSHCTTAANDGWTRSG